MQNFNFFGEKFGGKRKYPIFAPLKTKNEISSLKISFQ
jgi:hypothetical protein